MKWFDKSDKKTRFFVAESDVDINGEDFLRLIHELLCFVLENLLNIDPNIEFDTFFVEVNCDTGRIILSASTEQDRLKGTLHGCAVRLSKLQAVWYHWAERGVSDEEFRISIENEVLRIGLLFESELQKFREFSAKSRNGSFELIVYGIDPGKILLRNSITSKN